MGSIDFTEEDWLPIAFVSGLLAVSERTLRGWRAEGRRQRRTPQVIGPLKPGRPALHFRIKDVKPLLETNVGLGATVDECRGVPVSEVRHQPTYTRTWTVTCACGEWTATGDTKGEAADAYHGHLSNCMKREAVYGDPRRHAKVERNRQLVERVGAGETVTDVARALGMSPAYAREIVVKAQNRRVRAVPVSEGDR